MSSASMIRSAAAVSLIALAGVAHADWGGISPDRMDFIRHAAGQVGNGVGYLHLPTSGQIGYFNAVLEDRAGNADYTIDASLTTFLPSVDLWGEDIVASGGIHGNLREAPPPGVHLFRPPPVIGEIEGLWTLDNRNRGYLEALVYMRGPNGNRRFAGLVTGYLLARDLRVVHPPLAPGLAGAGVSGWTVGAAGRVRALDAPAVGRARRIGSSGLGAIAAHGNVVPSHGMALRTESVALGYVSAGGGDPLPDLGRYRKSGAVLAGNPARRADEILLDRDVADASSAPPPAGIGATAVGGDPLPGSGDAAHGYPRGASGSTVKIAKAILRYKLLD